MKRRAGLVMVIVWIGMLPGLLGCAPVPEAPLAAETPSPVRRLADEYMEAFLDRYPETGTYYGIPGRRHDRLTDNSLAALAGWQAREDAWLARLAELETPAPDSPDWALHGILLETLAAAVVKRICRDELWAVSETDGWQTWLPFIAEIQPVGSAEQRQEALARARELGRYLDSEIVNLREGLRLGYSAPRRNVGLVVDQVRGLLAHDSPFSSPARRDADATFQTAFTEVVEREVEPALRRYVGFLETEYLGAAREAIAVVENPDGAACYLASVRYHATVDLPAREIHDLGLEQMALIQQEMLEIAERSFGTSDVSALLKRLTTEPEFAFSSREEIIRYSQDAVERAREVMPRFFRLQPRADVVIEPYPAYREVGGTGEYQSPSVDGSRPGVYYIPVVDPPRRPRVGYESLAFHETIPGHHLQLAIAVERTGSHPLARYLDKSGYSEGWGLYSERLADEMGLYSSELARLGMLGDQAARAARLVIDAGIHELGWSRRQAIDYMIAHTTWAPQDVEAEVDRYIIWPGQATAYMLGMLKLRELRERSEEALGESFDIRDFHDRVLEDGAVSLGMLERKIDHWISRASERIDSEDRRGESGP